mmetsp:Transcript_26756/g.61651  ORF Transcript_26756/g.61651 Transcript_26756/m.61651 type:complete len:223 (-) Transcript_26756:276-944(-)
MLGDITESNSLALGLNEPCFECVFGLTEQREVVTRIRTEQGSRPSPDTESSRTVPPPSCPVSHSTASSATPVVESTACVRVHPAGTLKVPLEVSCALRPHSGARCSCMSRTRTENLTNVFGHRDMAGTIENRNTAPAEGMTDAHVGSLSFSSCWVGPSVRKLRRFCCSARISSAWTRRRWTAWNEVWVPCESTMDSCGRYGTPGGVRKPVWVVFFCQCRRTL